MTIDRQETDRADAIGWHIRLRHGGDADWEAFEAWLAADPAHVLAYHEIEDADQAIEAHLSDLRFEEVLEDRAIPLPVSRRRVLWIAGGGALAAGLIAMVTLAPGTSSGRYDVATRPGEKRVVTLGEDARVTLGGETRMTFDRKDPRFARLASGDASFQVRHDATRPFRLHVGSNIVEDAGTIFDVAHRSGGVRVSVVEGSIVYNPGGRQTVLVAGEALVDPGDGKPVVVSRTAAAPADRSLDGQLVYRGEPLSKVAADLSRVTGLRIDVAPEIAARAVHGTIATGGRREDLFARLEAALNILLVPDEGGWLMRPARDAAP